MNSYINNQAYLEARQKEKELAEHISALSNILPALMDKDRRKSVLQELARGINKFDDHLRYIIKAWPDYYLDYEELIKNILIENADFLHTTLKELNILNKTKSN